MGLSCFVAKDEHSQLQKETPTANKKGLNKQCLGLGQKRCAPKIACCAARNPGPRRPLRKMAILTKMLRYHRSNSARANYIPGPYGCLILNTSVVGRATASQYYATAPQALNFCMCVHSYTYNIYHEYLLVAWQTYIISNTHIADIYVDQHLAAHTCNNSYYVPRRYW